MSSNAFNDLERESTLRAGQAEISRAERARNIDKRAFEQAQRESLIDALRLDRAAGSNQMALAYQRIAILEEQRDETAHEILEWVKDLQSYFPGASTMHDIYRGIEALENQRDELSSVIRNLIKAIESSNGAGYQIAMNAARDVMGRKS